MRRDNFLHNVESKSCTAWLGGIERLKNPPQMFVGNTSAGILHPDLCLRWHTPAHNREHSPGGHGLHGILHQVEEYPAEHAGMKRDTPQVRDAFQPEDNAVGYRKCPPLHRPGLYRSS
jgi:hypothetical protein